MAYCEVGGHETEEEVYKCISCGRTFCPEHGSVERGLCIECLKKENSLKSFKDVEELHAKEELMND